MKTLWLKTLCAMLLAPAWLPLSARADTPALPWAASAQAPTTFAVPAGQDAAVMAQAFSLVSGWKTRDSRMYPMQITIHTDRLIQTADPTALGLFGVKITDTPTMGVAVITVETSAYEGKVFLIGQQRRDAAKRAHALAYLLEQSAGVAATAPPPANLSVIPPPPVALSPAPAAPQFAAPLDALRTELNAGAYDAALATLDALRAEIVRRASGGGK